MTTAPTEALKLYGTEQEAPAARTLSAGALSAELEAGKLRWIRYGGTEALRGIAFVVRGSGWETYAPEIANLEIEEGGGRFRVGYDARIESGDGVLAFRADIVAENERSLVFTVEFRPETEFRTNRTGFVALHAIEGVAGEACTIIHSDGTVEETEFPGLIMPLQPFFDIAAMRHQVSPGVWLTCRFEGADPWETEDQRNWTDASYKTYYRPLALPYPYTLAAGETLRQTATLTIEGGSAAVATAAGGDDGAVEIAVGGETGQHMPEIGLGVAASERDHLDHGLDLLRALGPGHLVCECDPRDDRSVETLAACRELAQALDAEVVLEIVVPCERPVADELAAAAEIAGRAGLAPAAIVPEQARLLKFTLEKIPALGIPDFDEVYGAARAAFPGVRLGGGVFTNFTELNRNCAAPELFDFLTHATCAVVHEPDDRSVMETLQTLPDIVASAKAWAGGKPYRIAPSAIGMRFNPYGPDVHHNSDNGRYSFSRQDPRHRALLGAAFTLGYAARVAPLRSRGAGAGRALRCARHGLPQDRAPAALVRRSRRAGGAAALPHRVGAGGGEGGGNPQRDERRCHARPRTRLRERQRDAAVARQPLAGDAGRDGLGHRRGNGDHRPAGLGQFRGRGDRPCRLRRSPRPAGRPRPP